jgi:hypothetical protein
VIVQPTARGVSWRTVQDPFRGPWNETGRTVIATATSIRSPRQTACRNFPSLHRRVDRFEIELAGVARAGKDRPQAALLWVLPVQGCRPLLVDSDRAVNERRSVGGDEA